MNELKLNTHVKYYDMLELERFGYIVAIEESKVKGVPYIYIEDEEQEYNIHRDMVNGVLITYAEIRPSDQIIIDN